MMLKILFTAITGIVLSAAISSVAFSQDAYSAKSVYSKASEYDVKKSSEIAYKNVGSGDMTFDIYSPKSISKTVRLPIVILVHGESTQADLKNSGQMISMGVEIAARGMIAIAFNHRTLIGGATPENILDDINDLRDFINANSVAFGADTSRTAVWAFSAGMPFGLLSSAEHRPESVKCFVGYYGFGSLKDMSSYSREHFKNKIKTKLNEGIPDIKCPVLAARAGLDDQDINKSFDAFTRDLIEKGVSLDLYNHPVGGHAFDIFNNDKRSKDIVDHTLEFLEKHLK